MKNASDKIIVLLLLTAGLQLRGQGLIYDQQSAVAPLAINYDNFSLYIQPLYESFIPTLSSIDFVQLELTDYPDTSTAGAKICVGLYSGSPGNFVLMGTTKLESLPANFHNEGLAYSGIASFYFATPIALTPGQTYFLEPVEITGDHVWSVAVMDHAYANGQLYGGAYPFTPPVDLWFREGIVVPEPSDWALLAMGGLLLTWISRVGVSFYHNGGEHNIN